MNLGGVTDEQLARLRAATVRQFNDLEDRVTAFRVSLEKEHRDRPQSRALNWLIDLEAAKYRARLLEEL